MGESGIVIRIVMNILNGVSIIFYINGTITVVFCIYNINFLDVCCLASWTGTNQLYVLQLQTAEAMQSSSSSSQHVADVSSFLFMLPSTALTSTVAPTDALGSRNQVKL